MEFANAKSVAGLAVPTPQLPPLETIAETISDMIQVVQNVTELLHSHADRVHGPAEPEKTGPPPGSRPEPMGWIDKIYAGLSVLQEAHDNLKIAAVRNTRLG